MAVSKTGGAKSGALEVDSDLERIVELWPRLTAATWQALLTMAEDSE